MGNIKIENKILIEILKKNREEINKQVDIARQKNPRIDYNAIKYGLKHVFEPLFSLFEIDDMKKLEDIFEFVFDLFLYAVSKRYYALPGKNITSIRMELLFEQLLPLIPEILAKSPTSSIGRLINAGENLRDKSEEFYRRLIKVAKVGCLNSDNLANVGIIIAWSVGETRLRQSALKILEKLNPDLIVTLLDLDKIPRSITINFAPYISTILEYNKWRSLNKPFSEKFMKLIQNGQIVSQDLIENEIKGSGIITTSKLKILNDVGGFYGFGGGFKTPPRIIWGPNETLIAYTPDGGASIIYLDGNGSKIKKLIPNDFQSLSYHPEIGFVGVLSKGEIVNLTTDQIYSEKISGTKKIFDFCTSYTTSDSIFIIHKNKEIFRITNEGITKNSLKKHYDELTVTPDNRLFYIEKSQNTKDKRIYYLSETTLNEKSKRISEVASDGDLRVISPYAYIFKEPDKLFIYNIDNPAEKNIKKIPLKIKRCTSFLINQKEIYFTLKYSYHFLCFGVDPYLN